MSLGLFELLVVVMIFGFVVVAVGVVWFVVKKGQDQSPELERRVAVLESQLREKPLGDGVDSPGAR